MTKTQINHQIRAKIRLAGLLEEDSMELSRKAQKLRREAEELKRNKDLMSAR